jgi:hypothetical protein
MDQFFWFPYNMARGLSYEVQLVVQLVGPEATYEVFFMNAVLLSVICHF